MLARADAITLHTPLTDQTRNILSAEALAKTKKGVILVNCARGGLVDEAAVAEGLKSGHIGAAAFDVFAEEPAKENVLFGAPNFIATPHLGAATTEAQENVALQVAEQMSDYLLTGAVTNALNMPSITADEAPRLKPFAALAEKLGLPLEKIRKVLKIAKEPISLETPIGDDEDSNLGDFIEDKNAVLPLDSAIQENLKETTTRVLASLTPREERVLRMRFGIGMNTDHTLEEVGQQFSVTRERIRQIEAKALRKLKHPSRSRKLRSFLES